MAKKELTLKELIAQNMDENLKNATKIYKTTPVGVASYPHLLKRDEYQFTEQGKEQCNTKLKLDPNNEADAAFIEFIDQATQIAFDVGMANLKEQLSEAKGKKKVDLEKLIKELAQKAPYEPDYDEEGGETGLFVFSMKTTVAGVDPKTKKRWQRDVPLFDAHKQKIEGKARDKLRLYGGARIAVSLQVVPYCAEGLKIAGVSLRIMAVQVISVPAGSGGSADSHGFGVEESGYKVETFDNSGRDEDLDGDDDDDDVTDSSDSDDEEQF